jgi:DoxX-like family
MSAALGVPSSRGRLWTGRVLSALPVLMMVMSAVMKFMKPAPVIETFVTRLGFPENTLLPIGVLELVCVTLYAIPQTAVLGAVLVTGYLGGAITSHVRVGDPFVPPLVLGVLAWVGLYLRDERLSALLPLRKL